MHREDELIHVHLGSAFYARPSILPMCHHYRRPVPQAHPHGRVNNGTRRNIQGKCSAQLKSTDEKSEANAPPAGVNLRAQIHRTSKIGTPPPEFLDPYSQSQPL